jgi:hypothetical protein
VTSAAKPGTAACGAAVAGETVTVEEGRVGMLRRHHYERAFEAWLRSEALPYVAVDEARRALSPNGSLKSPDFVVTPAQGPAVVLEVKGRRASPQGRTRENWVTTDDLWSLCQWERLFGPRFRAALVFVYDCGDAVSTHPAAAAGPETPWDSHDDPASPELAVSWELQGRRYAAWGVWAATYCQAMRARSARWSTVWLPAEQYRAHRFSLVEWTRQSNATRSRDNAGGPVAWEAEVASWGSSADQSDWPAWGEEPDPLEDRSPAASVRPSKSEVRQ